MADKTMTENNQEAASPRLASEEASDQTGGVSMQHAPLHIGIDVGSTTVKVAVLDDENTIQHSCYKRHHADIRATIIEVVGEAAEQYPDTPMTIAITGSGGLLLAQWLGIEFVQNRRGNLHSADRRGDRAWWRRCKNHLFRQRYRAAHERYLRRWHGCVH